MSFNSTTDIVDEEFGFRCKRIINRQPPPSAITPNSDVDYDQYTDDYDTGTKRSRTGNYYSSYSSGYGASPLSPTSPYSQEKPVHNPYASVDVLSPEPTVKQNLDHDDIPHSDKIEAKDTKTPEPSTFLSLIKPDLPKTERIRQLFLMTLRYELDKQFPITGDKDLDEFEKKSRDKIRVTGYKAIEEISNRGIDLFDHQHSGEIDTKFVYAEPSPKNEWNRKQIRESKKLCTRLEEELKQRKTAMSKVYSYHAKCQDEYQPLMMKGWADYMDLMLPHQREFIQSMRTNDTSDSLIPSMEKAFTNLGRNITELRQQLNYASETQKEAGEHSAALMKDLSRQLKLATLRFPALAKTNDSERHIAIQPSLESIDTNYLKERAKKRRILGLSDDTEMEAKATFDFLKAFSKLR